tara:strand:+ start:53448 stop:53675 length:228 start_codon:yes stop_codon:yes gene_type:complete
MSTTAKFDRLRSHLSHQARILLQNLAGKTEADTLGFHHPVNHRARRATAKAVKQLFFGVMIRLGVSSSWKRHLMA